MKRYKITVSGRVQGVGFRPTVYRYAISEKLAGFVSNTAEGVFIEVEGDKKNIKNFLRKLKLRPPRQSKITKISVKKILPKFEKKFIIKKSTNRSRGKTSLHISPDISICDDCLKELFDKNDRRYLYPFINCTNCGPRFSIIKDIPYDRKKTVMRKFKMCGNCQEEYGNPSDRRFHAQPDACWDCGPDVKLLGRGTRDEGRGIKAIQKTVKLLRQGKIIAVKGIGGFHICCDAINDKAVKKLRHRKKRPDKPFAVMMPDIETIKKYCYVSGKEKNILLSSERPIILLRKRTQIFELVAPNNNYLGVMLPYTPLHYLLFGLLPTPYSLLPALIMTSGNKQDEPICCDNADAINELSGICDYFLIHNRDILNRCDDSIVQVDDEKNLKFIRRSRGYIPNPISLPATRYPLPAILSTGAELKNTFCLTRGNEAYPSQYIGDLKDAKSYEFYKDALVKMKNLLKVEPKIIVHDLHPDYFSTKYAKSLANPQNKANSPTGISFSHNSPATTRHSLFAIPVQHHYAHIASVCAEHKINSKVIGVAFDGTGYGTDGNIWGGEFLIANGDGTFERKYHLRYTGLPGGDVATNEIWRIGFSYLYSVFGDKAIKYYPNKKISVVKKMIEKKVNCPITSSVGRLFDAVASIINLRQEITCESQAAVELEQMADDRLQIADCYEYEIIKDEIDVKKMIVGIVDDLKNKKSKSEISVKFHNTLAKIILDICKKLKKETKINRVALSGGVFQNSVLVEKSVKLLESAGFKVFTNNQVPSNDGGISLGQVWIALKLLTSDKKFNKITQ
ncbi:MAG TPA: carbamoyltransferase HypF [Elusimicrobia bacterium]|nr:carbamoyltransferase HypF [Elusimicrobiota bacterium]